jgi:hypothetical protein
MSMDYIEVTVRQTIPADCLAGIERWLLARIFKIEERGDSLVFYGCWHFHGHSVSPDDELTEALTASREICPELCAAVEREIDERKEILGWINYERIFQSIVQRHPELLQHISIEEVDSNTRRGPFRETFTLITAQCIKSINSDKTGPNGLVALSPYFQRYPD